MKGLLREKNNSIEKSLKNRKTRKKLGQKKKNCYDNDKRLKNEIFNNGQENMKKVLFSQNLGRNEIIEINKILK